jgi:uncharacterized protein (TIGR02118 family)
MIQVTVLYPNGTGRDFDAKYYCRKHVPMMKRLLGSALKGISVEEGIAGTQNGSQAPFLAMVRLKFESMQAFEHSFWPHLHKIIKDVPYFTNSQPVIQVSEMRLWTRAVDAQIRGEKRAGND